MVEIKGEMKLTQKNEVIKHINLELIMKYVNKLHNTRRVERKWYLLSKENKNKIGFDPEKYGAFGRYYYKNDLEETITNINDFGTNPSLILPYYIEKNEKNEYILKSSTNPKGNHLDSSSGWLYFLHRELFYHLGIEVEGNFKIKDFESEIKAIVKSNNKGVQFKSSNMEDYKEAVNKDYFINKIKTSKRKKRNHYPFFLEEISKKIEEKELKEDYSFEP